jgi:putative (di)nucleoside polyphosphate hydrolase
MSGPPAGYRPGVGLMLLDRTGRVWIGRRRGMPGDVWQMPQGGIEPGETPRAAALRELAEEVGTSRASILAETRDWLTYDLPPELAASRWKGRYRGQAQRWFALAFEGHDAEIDLAAHAKPEFDAWRWAQVDELAGLIVAFKRALYERVILELGPIARRRALGR